MQDSRDEQFKILQDMARRVLEPWQKAPFGMVIELTTGVPVERILDCAEDKQLIGVLSDAAMQVTAESQSSPLFANRPNDVSTKFEELVKSKLKGSRVEPVPVTTRKGKKGGQGYPDMKLVQSGNRVTYLDIKVSRLENIDQASARNFFYQPQADSRITEAARHLLLGFAIREVSEKKWLAEHWRLVDLWGLSVNLKHEFNADNTEIYRKENRLAEGDASGKVVFLGA